MQYEGNNWDAIEPDNYHTMSVNMYDCTNLNKNNNNNFSCNVYDKNNNNNYSFQTNNMNSISNNANNTSFVSYNVPSSGTNSRCTGFDGPITAHNTLNIIHENDIGNNNDIDNVNKFTNRCNKEKEHDNNVWNGNDSFISNINYFNGNTNITTNNINPNNINNVNSNNHNFNVPYNHSDTNLFFRHLPHSIDDFTLRHIFSAFGSVLSAAIMRDIHTGESLGTAFVRFENHEDALAAMKYYARHPFISSTSPELTELSSQELQMSSSSSPEPTFVQASATNHTHSANRGKNDELHTRKPLVVQWAKKVHDDAIVGAERLKRRKLFVRNIPTEITEEAILNLMQPFGLIEDVTLHEDTVPPPPPPPPSQSHQSNPSSLAVGANTAVVSTNQNEVANGDNALNTDANKVSVGTPPLPPPPHESSALEEKKLIAFITFAQDGAAASACEAIHNTCPFPECNGIPFMAKLADPNRRRHEALRNHHHQGSHHNNQQHDLSYNRANTYTHHGHSYKTNNASAYRNNINNNNSGNGNDNSFSPQSGVLYNNYTSAEDYPNNINKNLSTPFHGSKDINEQLNMSESSIQNTPFLHVANAYNNYNTTNENNSVTYTKADGECCSYIEQNVDNDNRMHNTFCEQDARSTGTQNNAALLENAQRVSCTPRKPVVVSSEMSYNNKAMPYYHTNVPTFPLFGETNMTPKMKEEEHDLHSFSLAMESYSYNPVNSLSCTPNEQRYGGGGGNGGLDRTMPHYMETQYTYSDNNDSVYNTTNNNMRNNINKNNNNFYNDNTYNNNNHNNNSNNNNNKKIINKSNEYSFISFAKMGLTSETSCLLSCDSMTNSVTSTHGLPLQQQEQEQHIRRRQAERYQQHRLECESSGKFDSTARSIRTTQSSPALSSISHARNDNVCLSIYAPGHTKQLPSATTRSMTTLEIESNLKCANSHDVNSNIGNFNQIDNYCIHTLPPVLCLAASYDRAEPSAESMNSAALPASASASNKILSKELRQVEKTTDAHFSSSTSGTSAAERLSRRDVPRYRYNPYNLDNPRQIMNVCHNSTLSSHTTKINSFKTKVSA